MLPRAQVELKWARLGPLAKQSRRRLIRGLGSAETLTMVALSACVPRWPKVRRHRDRRRSPNCRSQQRQRGEIHTRQPPGSRFSGCVRGWPLAMLLDETGTVGVPGGRQPWRTPAQKRPLRNQIEMSF
jgi:hypothetical protein